MKVITYELIEDGEAIRCLVCLSESNNQAAIQGLLCPQCGVKHEQLASRIERAIRENLKVQQASRTLKRAAKRR
jgi:hypothetical protein